MDMRILLSVVLLAGINCVSIASASKIEALQELAIRKAQVLAVHTQPHIKDNFALTQSAIEEDLQMPEPDPDGRVQTLNKKGAMSPQLDPISLSFVEAAAKPNMRAVEIGAGYGLACIDALKMGASDIWVNDLDPRHLKVTARRLYELDPSYLTKVHLIHGAFPEEVKLPESSFDVLLVARVLHFMTPEQAVRTLMSAHRCLKPGGKIYAVMLSPYVRGFSSFIPTFEKRIANCEPYPGWVENLIEIADTSVVPLSALNNMEKRPFLFFDTRTATSIFEKAGFTIEKAVETPLAYKSEIWQLDGRENIGVIAVNTQATKL